MHLKHQQHVWKKVDARCNVESGDKISDIFRFLTLNVFHVCDYYINQQEHYPCVCVCVRTLQALYIDIVFYDFTEHS